MPADWPRVPLGEVLTHRKEFVQIDDFQTYKRCRVQLHAQGVVLRDEVPGAEIKTKKQQVCRPGEFLVAEIDAKLGGYGIVPPDLDGAIVSSHYFLFVVNDAKLDRRFLDYFIRTPAFREQVEAQGSTNYAAIRPAHVLGYTLPLPPVAEQRRIVARVDAIAARIKDVRRLREEAADHLNHLLQVRYGQFTRNAPRRPMSEVAPLIRRKVEIEIEGVYPELGIRSFARGTFHKPPLLGADVGSKKLFEIHPGDLVFNNVFAWEGAVAVAKPHDEGRFGSHRFITCRTLDGVSTPEFLFFHFQTDDGLNQLREASPGGAGRNRTLGLEALSRITVPVPPHVEQLRFDALQEKADALRSLQAETAADLDALLPAVLAKAFAGGL